MSAKTGKQCQFGQDTFLYMSYNNMTKPGPFICYCRSADVELQLKLTNCRVATVLEIREKSGKVKRG